MLDSRHRSSQVAIVVLSSSKLMQAGLQLVWPQSTVIGQFIAMRTACFFGRVLKCGLPSAEQATAASVKFRWAR